MVTRRQWLQRGAVVVIGGASVTIGKPTNAAPAVEPLSVEICGIYMTAPGKGNHIMADLTFAADGSFRIVPKTYVYDKTYSDGEEVFGEPIVSGPNATARDLIEALTR